MRKSTPSTKGEKGSGKAERDPETGRFLPGHNAPGPGNPHAQRVARLRSELLNAVSRKDLREIIKALVEQAKRGDTAAAREVLDRTLGKPVEADLIERMEQLEKALEGKGQHNGYRY